MDEVIAEGNTKNKSRLGSDFLGLESSICSKGLSTLQRIPRDESDAKVMVFPESAKEINGHPCQSTGEICTLVAALPYSAYIWLRKIETTVVESAGNETRSKAVPFRKALPSQRIQFLILNPTDIWRIRVVCLSCTNSIRAVDKFG